MKGGWRELDGSANDALTRFFNRTNWEPVYSDLPFDEIIASEEDGEDGIPGEYELRQRIAGVRAFFRFMTARGVHPAAMLKQLAAAGRACHVAPFHQMTMGELGQLFSETKAAHSWRCKILSRTIELSGMRGGKLPGQKSKQATESYREIRKGNTNRKPKKDRRRQVQSSFLRKLKVTPTP
jgi:hypothetical protein